VCVFVVESELGCYSKTSVVASMKGGSKWLNGMRTLISSSCHTVNKPIKLKNGKLVESFPEKCIKRTTTMFRDVEMQKIVKSTKS
jgi:hypothetical protein